MSKTALIDFLKAQVREARDTGVLFSLHMKATMMKVSDPIIFGHAVEVFFEDVFNKHRETFDSIGVDVRNGFGDLTGKLAELPADKRAEIEADIAAATQTVQPSPWSTPTRASRIFTCPATSSSMPQCRL